MKKFKLKPRARVSQEFMEIYQDLARRKLEQIENKTRFMGDSRRHQYFKNNAAMIARLHNVYKGVSDAGIGLDFELSRFRSLNYEYIKVVHPPALPAHLCGLVRSPIMDVLEGSKKVGEYESGQYFFYVNTEMLLNGNADGLHFIPERAPYTRSRHPHHRAYGEDGKHPLSWRTSTCWDQFGAVISLVLSQLDLVELFRMGQVFANRYYPGSPLVYLSNMPFIKEVQA